ncbi:MAG TPA: cytochrome c biogenesis protein CcdA [Cyclobacteriaceae bacterium]|nr:cytochrome c biogenesis protein CcdA [Cyclobacteriaceae bacterium]
MLSGRTRLYFYRVVMASAGLFFSLIGYTQVIKPIHWSFETSVNEAKTGDEIDLVFNAIIDDKWYLYSSDFDPDLGPMVTEFEFEPNSTYQLVGGIIPVNPKKKYDDIWKGEYTYFSGKGQFRQKVKVLSAGFHVSGILTYQVCSDIDGKCIPFEDEFTIDKLKVSATQGSQAVKESVDPHTQKTIEPTADSVTAGAGDKSAIREPGISPVIDVIPFTADSVIKPGLLETGHDKSILLSREPDDAYSLLTFIILAFLGGLAALLTPCVFPMIPMTVSFFTGKASNRKQSIRNAFVYGFSIIIIYTLVGALLAPFMGPDTANFLATHWIPNTIFFLVFILFALSFFGLFEITLPSGLVNKIDKQADKGGIMGIFFMGLTLVLVSFSCTGPIVGSILVESAGGMTVKPLMGMLGFSLAFAIPFTLFAIFPEWISSLPKSGGWLNSVKVVLGFLELALAFKFLSVADQAYHWNILDREVYLALWIVIFTLMGFYILGKIRLPGDSNLENISVIRLLLAVITFSFVIYLIPGMFGAPLKALSGYLPPVSTQDFNIAGMGGKSENSQAGNEYNNLCTPPLHADLLHFPHDIHGYFDYDQAIECARQKNKPLFIDFTGHGCVNCREMEARVWSDPEVLKRLKNDFIVVALYVDDKTVLPETEWYVSIYDGKVKKSIGKQNADFQITRFNNNAQPFYVILDNSEKFLMAPRAYDLSVEGFVKFLDEAKGIFEKRQMIRGID